MGDIEVRRIADKVRKTSDEVDEQAERCWQLHIFEGLPQRTIAEREGVSQVRVSQLLDRVRSKIPQRTVDHLISASVERYGALRARYWAPAINGDLDAAEFVRKIEADERKLLGLDQPTKVESMGELVHRVIGVSNDDI